LKRRDPCLEVARAHRWPCTSSGGVKRAEGATLAGGSRSNVDHVSWRESDVEVHTYRQPPAILPHPETHWKADLETN
jgi:hypothetical protein